MDYSQFGLVRAAVAAPRVRVADPAGNAAAILDTYRELVAAGASLVVTPELGVTGYTCEDLFGAEDLLAAAREALALIAGETGDAALVIGAPWRLPDGRLLNAGLVCAGGRVVGAVPKSALPNHEEFYEKRWFASGEGVAVAIDDDRLGRFAMNPGQLFDIGGVRFAVEICEDLWSPAPPSVGHALAGADIVVNLSASNELVAKADYRRDLVRMQSARLVCGYLYASSGPPRSPPRMSYTGATCWRRKTAGCWGSRNAFCSTAPRLRWISTVTGFAANAATTRRFPGSRRGRCLSRGGGRPPATPERDVAQLSETPVRAGR